MIAEKLRNKIKDTFVLKNIPLSATAREWKEWNLNAKKTQPFAYAVSEAMDWIHNRYRDCIKPFQNTRCWIRYRIFDRYHVINTGLTPQYYDCDTRMLHGMFNMLIDFVEIEKAWMYVVFDKPEQRKRNHPWWSKGWTRFKSFRDPDAGLAHLDWESSLDDPKLSKYERADHQAIVAREIKFIYNWWKNIRPNRPDPMDASGWSAICNEKRKNGSSVWEFLDHEDETEEYKERSNNALNKLREIETSYEKEDEEMLHRLIKIRKHLWT